jgi:LysM repeat protein
MTGRLLRIALLALLLTLSGCFRPAGEAIEPTVNSGVQPEVPTSTTESLDNGGLTPTEEESFTTLSTDEGPPTAAIGEVEPTFPPITVIQPTRAVVETDAAPENFAGNTALPGTTPTYITPGVPPGPLGSGETRATATGGAFTATPSGLITPTDMFTQEAGGCTYTVESGDTLFRIARNNNIELEELRAANPDLVGDDPIIHPGDALTLPNCGTAQAPAGSATQVPTPLSAPAGGEVYTVKSGDTLVRIAEEFGLTVDEIIAANTLDDPDRLDVGQEIIIPPRAP